MAHQDDTDSRAWLLDLLLDKVAEDRFPSTTMLDLIEQIMEPDDVPAYAAVLMQKIRDEAYPSVPMMSRLVELTR